MPIYTFENTKTGEVYDDMMSIADMKKFLKKNKHIKQRLTTINISSVQGQYENRWWLERQPIKNCRRSSN